MASHEQQKGRVERWAKLHDVGRTLGSTLRRLGKLLVQARDLAFEGTRILKLVLRALWNLSILGLETSSKEMDLVLNIGQSAFQRHIGQRLVVGIGSTFST